MRKKMASAESAYSDAGHSEHSLNRDCPLLVERKNAEIFGAFLDEFAGKDWASPSARELPTASPFTDEDYYGCERGHSGLFASDASTSCSITGVDSPPQISTADSKILRKSSSAASSEECDNSHPDSNRDKTDSDAPITSDAFLVDAILAHTSIRVLTNTTYLRRMHLSRDDAVALFPEVKKTTALIFATDIKRNVLPGHFKAGIDVSLHGRGRRWPIVLEIMHAAGQRHVRLNKGWVQMCSANGFAIGKRLRLALWEQASSLKEALVAVSTL